MCLDQVTLSSMQRTLCLQNGNANAGTSLNASAQVAEAVS